MTGWERIGPEGKGEDWMGVDLKGWIGGEKKLPDRMGGERKGMDRT